MDTKMINDAEVVEEPKTSKHPPLSVMKVDEGVHIAHPEGAPNPPVVRDVTPRTVVEDKTTDRPVVGRQAGDNEEHPKPPAA